LEYIAKYHPAIKTCLKKYPHLKKQFEKKKDYILQNPLQLGEPLKGNLNGLRSFPLAGNYIIIFIVCNDCRRLKQKEINRCLQCGQIPHNSVIFLLFGQHDPSYKIAPRLRGNLGREGFDVFI